MSVNEKNPEATVGASGAALLASAAGVPRPGRASSRRVGRFSMSLNLTPMIDIVFLLLFFFLSVSQFRSPEGMLAAQLPSASAAAVAAVPREPIRIRLDGGTLGEPVCRARIDELLADPVPMERLRGELIRIRDELPGFGRDTPVYLYASDAVVWDHVVNAYHAAMSAEYHRIYFAKSP